MAVLALENAIQLHRDSIHLIRRRSYGSSVALSVLAAEEIGKYFLIEDLVWRSDIEGPRSPQDQELWLSLAYDHHAKQGQFAMMGRFAFPDEVVQRILHGALEREKQRGFYVGLPRRKKGLDLSARISSPHLIGRRSAETQITTVSDFLVVFAVGCANEHLGIDVRAAEELVTLGLARSLRRWWPHMGREARRYVRRFAPDLLRRRP